MDIVQEEVVAALKRMKKDKAPGPSRVTSDLLRLEALTESYE